MFNLLIFVFCLLFNVNTTTHIEIKTMPDDNYKKAIEMATQMDNDFQQDYDNLRNEDFLKIISMIESSGGKNFDHREIQSGIHEGHRAAGRYGLMPNTMQEIANRMEQDGSLSDELRQITSLPPDQMKAAVEADPMHEQRLAEYLAQKVLDNQHGDEEKAAYSWFQGHNLGPKEIESRNYKEHDYVKKFNEYRDPENFEKLNALLKRKP